MNLKGNSMTHTDYLNLINQIKYHDDLYYNESQPEITDSEYDALYFQLQTYEKEHPSEISAQSPTQSISREKTTNKIKHPFSLLSLKKANTYDEVSSYLKKFAYDENLDEFSTNKFMLQLKEDGLTIALYYNWFPNQPFVAATRGGGDEGQDVSLQMNAFAKKLQTKKPVVIRGEAVIKNDVFDQLNEDGVYMNPRNAVSGMLHKEAPANDITFIAYNIENAEDIGLSTETEMLQQLEDWGFTTPELQKTFKNDDHGKDNLIKFIKDFEKDNKRLSLDHDIDGLVIKPDYIANRRILGNTSHHPKNQLAYKFASPDAITILKDVVWQDGAKGRLTPVGIFDKVVLLGANVTRASLANYGNIEKRDIKIGDTILVRRSNDVIPQIVKSFSEKRTGVEKDIQIPKDAYFSGKNLFTKKVSNERLLNRWRIFVSKDGLDLKQVSQKAIESLIDNDFIDINDFSSLWNVIDHKYDLRLVEGWYILKTNNLVDQLSTPIKVTMPKFLYSLALNGVGHDTSSKISLLYPTIESIINNKPAMTLDEWHKIVGNISEAPIEEIFTELDLIKNLKDKVDIIKDQSKITSTSNSLLGKTFVITGKSDKYTRNDLKKMIEEANGVVKSAVTKSLDYLIELDPSSKSTKTKKANELKISIINEEEFLNMI